MKTFTSKLQKIGKLGEDIASRFLLKHGFSVLDKNYTKKWGEIDIVAKRDDTIHFIEVKSASRSIPEKNTQAPSEDTEDVTYETESFFKPEENVHPWKRKRLARTIETYLIHNRIGNTPWQFDILLVFLDLKGKRAKVETIENVIL